jgi:hypothetical protein
MRRFMRVVALAALLTVVTGGATANAHTPGYARHASATSYYICSATRPATTQVDTSKPVFLSTTHVIYSCTGHSHTSAHAGIVCSWRTAQPRSGPAYRLLGTLQCSRWSGQLSALAGT